MAVLLQEEFRRAGVDMRVEQIEIGTMAERQNQRRFEAIFGGWNMDPSLSAIRQTFTTTATKPGGYNYIHYANPAFDALVDSATGSMDPERSRRYYGRAYELIVQDAPAMFMYEFQGLAGAHRRLNITGGRPDAWWAGIGDWSIPADQRIERDQIGLRTVTR